MTALDPKIETVARAICDVWGYDWDGPEGDDQTPLEVEDCCADKPSKQLFREAARAALAAASENEPVKAKAVFEKRAHSAQATILEDGEAYVKVTKLPDGKYYLSVFGYFGDEVVGSPPLTPEHFDMLGSIAVRMRAESAAKQEGDGT